MVIMQYARKSPHVDHQSAKLISGEFIQLYSSNICALVTTVPGDKDPHSYHWRIQGGGKGGANAPPF